MEEQLLTLEEYYKQESDGNAIKTSDYNKKEIDKAKKLAKEVSEFYPCEVYIEYSNEGGNKYFEYVFVQLSHPTLKIEIRKDSFHNIDKFFIICESINELKNISYYDMERIKENIEAPKNIGVLTSKKITDWINYHEKIYYQAKIINDNNLSKKEEFLKSIEGLDVTWIEKDKNGYIVKNGIEFTFIISDSNISTDIKINYKVTSSLENFLKLSDNQYKE